VAGRTEESDRIAQICAELLRLSRAQSEAIADDNVDRFIELLDRRANLISLLASEIADLTARENSEGDHSCCQEPSRFQSLRMLREIVRLDEENRRAIESRMVQLKSQLIEMGRGARALHEYRHFNRQRSPIFIDRLR